MKIYSYRYGSHYDPDANEVLFHAEATETGASVSISVDLDDDGITSVCCLIEQLEDMFLQELLRMGMKHPEARRRIADAMVDNLADAADAADVLDAVRKLRAEHPSRKDGGS